MATTNKGLNTPANGSNVNNWDVPVNANFTTIDTAFGGSVTVSSLTGGTSTFTSAQYTPPIIILTGTLTSNQTLNFPSGVGGVWSIYNNTTGSYTVTIGSGGGGSTVSITRGYRTAVVCDGTNVAPATTATPSSSPFQTGMVMLWSGSIGTIPTGWVICDGTNSTPDLRDRFVIGAGGSYSPGNTGGASNVSLGIGNLPAHNHGVNDPTHNHGVNDPTHNHDVNDPSHVHGLSALNGVIQAPGSGSALSGGNTVHQQSPAATDSAFTGISINAAYTGITNQPAYTGISTQSTGSGSSFNVLNPYYALAYIMKT
jgi:microcystin-dependent protein